MGGLRKYMPITFCDVHDRLARARRASSRSPGSGRRTRSSSTAGETGYTALPGRRPRRGVPDRGLHDPLPCTSRSSASTAATASRTSRRRRITVPLIMLAVASRRRRVPERGRRSASRSSRVVRSRRLAPRARASRLRLRQGRHLGDDRRRSASASPPTSGSSARSWARSRASRSATRSRSAGYTFLENKYYLDDLYENVIVGGIKGPDRARPAYWVNQHVIDGVVNGDRPRHGRGGPRFTYDVIDQKVVDGAVNGLAETTGETRWSPPLRPVGTRAALRATLFAAVGALSLALWLVY